MKWWLLSKAFEAIDSPNGPAIPKANWARGFFRIWIVVSGLWAGGVALIGYSSFEEAWAYQFGSLDYGIAVYPSDAGRLAIRDNRDWQSRAHGTEPTTEKPWVVFSVKWPSANVVFADVRDELLNGIRGPQEGIAERRVTLNYLEAATRKLTPESPDLKKLTDDELLAIRQVLSTTSLASLMVNFDNARGLSARENAIRDITLRRAFLEKPRSILIASHEISLIGYLRTTPECGVPNSGRLFKPSDT